MQSNDRLFAVQMCKKGFNLVRIVLASLHRRRLAEKLFLTKKAIKKVGLYFEYFLNMSFYFY